MSSKVDKALITGTSYEAMDEFGRKGAIANFTLDVINAFLGQVNLSHMQCKLPSGTRNPGEKNGPMLIVVAWEKVTRDDIKVLPRHAETAVSHFSHGKLSRKSNTFRIFATAFCVPL
jgi:hypothetical protein